MKIIEAIAGMFSRKLYMRLEPKSWDYNYVTVRHELGDIKINLPPEMNTAIFAVVEPYVKEQVRLRLLKMAEGVLHDTHR